MKLTVYAPSMSFGRSYFIATVLLVAAGLLHFFELNEASRTQTTFRVTLKIVIGSLPLLYAAALFFFARFKYKQIQEIKKKYNLAW